jgi:hypothetical protein
MKTQSITLECPLSRGETKIGTITLRRPNAGALRGIGLRSIMDMDVSAIATLLPRISDPTLIEADVDAMDPADLLQAGMAVASFFLPHRILDDVQNPGSFPT